MPTSDVFSQNEIEEIASSPAAQLELLDRFQEPETVAIDRELEQLRTPARSIERRPSSH